MPQDNQRELPYLAARPHLAIPVARDPTGRNGPTRHEAHGPGWRRVGHGRYVLSSTPQSTEQRILEAACLLPGAGGITGWAALYWRRGSRWFDGAAPGAVEQPVVLALGGDDVRPQTGIAVSAERLDPRDLVTIDGISATTDVRSVCFEMRYAADVRDAAKVLSMAAYDDAVSTAELAAYAARHRGWTGIPRCRDAIAFAEENCWSPAEFDMVWTWRVVAGLPRPLCNRPVFDRQGRHLGTPDLLDVEAGLVGQYDGRGHLAGAQRVADELAEERYRSVGLECFIMLAPDLGQPARMAERMLDARRRARWEAESVRAWTAEPPPWWVTTHTVALRRSLSEAQARRLLRYRVA